MSYYEKEPIQQETKMNLNSAIQFDRYSSSYFYNPYFKIILRRLYVKMKISKEIEKEQYSRSFEIYINEATVNI